MTLQTRLMRPEDAEGVASLAKAADPYAWSVDNFLEALKVGKRVVLGFFEDELVGFYVLSTVLDEAELEDIAVRPEDQGRGFGTALLNDVLKNVKLSAVRALHLEVRVSNARARHLYEKFGFKIDAVRPGYYRSVSGREDGLLMTKHLMDSVGSLS